MEMAKGNLGIQNVSQQNKSVKCCSYYNQCSASTSSVIATKPAHEVMQARSHGNIGTTTKMAACQTAKAIDQCCTSTNSNTITISGICLQHHDTCAPA
jgi:hypothetical protein